MCDAKQKTRETEFNQEKYEVINVQTKLVLLARPINRQRFSDMRIATLTQLSDSDSEAINVELYQFSIIICHTSQ